MVGLDFFKKNGSTPKTHPQHFLCFVALGATIKDTFVLASWGHACFVCIGIQHLLVSIKSSLKF